MSERVTMPALGESVTEGTVTRWLKNVGDTVAVDEPLLEVSTDKVDTEIPSPVAGVLQEILAGEDDTVPVGADLAVIGDGQGGDGQSSADAGSSDAGPQETQVIPEQGEQATQATQAPSTDQEPQQQNSEPEHSEPESSDGGSGDGETVTMPALGESVTEGTVTRWLKAEGDHVDVDEPLLEVSTDKVDTEIPSPVAGVLTKILVAEDDTVPVGAPLAIVGGSGGGQAPAAQEQAAPQQPEQPTQQEEPAPQPSAQAAPQPASQQEQAAPAPAPQAAPAPAPQAAPPQAVSSTPSATSDDAADASAYVTPLVRKLAADNNVDLGSLKGTGIGGRIRKQDVLDAAKAAQEA
ncbi:MAG TPA: biotin/lipoyl-containing protein, partial [Pedococcus sp.]|nr:biotin/lipoyl-containing protein [Pedococcus sp.]